MRVRTDARRKSVPAAAREMFSENGFERASMSETSDRLGGSKATLCDDVRPKEHRFAAALEQVIDDQANAAFARLTGAANLRTRLLDFARERLEARMAPGGLAIEQGPMSHGWPARPAECGAARRP